MLKRYFLVSFTGSNGIFGNLAFGLDCFPSNDFLRTEACEGLRITKEEIVITNIFEFKSKEDFDAFNE